MLEKENPVDQVTYNDVENQTDRIGKQDLCPACPPEPADVRRMTIVGVDAMRDQAMLLIGFIFDQVGETLLSSEHGQFA